MNDQLELLSTSPFFEVLPQPFLEDLAQHAHTQTFAEGTEFVVEGEPAERMYMVVEGSVELSFKTPEQADQDEQLMIRTISEPGRVVGWSAMVEPYHYRASARAKTDTVVLTFEREWLEQYADVNPEFGIQIMQRILWVLGNRLRETRIRLVARRYEKETLAIRALLDQSAEQLSVASPLHKIPFYLENRLTLSDAFQTLELLQVHGEELERNLASLCLDILVDVKRELTIYQRLQAIYELVAGARDHVSPAELRNRCSKAFTELFSHTNYMIDGEEHLPDESGHIFIMNHLDNHPDNELPNDFRLTLDTHFVSSMVLYRKYGESPIRVVRKSKPDEFGHQKYYDRLGYIYIFSGHVDEDEENPEHLAEQRRRFFLEHAKSYLHEGYNIVICPEGACTTTDQSPLPFKAGAFRLASHVRPEPLIVPIAVAHFDEKVTHTTLVARVCKPFRLSDEIGEEPTDQELYDFVNGFNVQFREEVRAAARLAHTREVKQHVS